MDSVYLLWLPLGTALIGALAALAGNAISPMFGAQKAHEQWLRDKRAERYERYYVTLDRARRQVGRYESAVTADGEFDHDIGKELWASAVSLEMYASHNTGKTVIEAAIAYQGWETSYPLQKSPDPRPDTGRDLARYEESKDFFAKANEARDVIRAELKVK